MSATVKWVLGVIVVAIIVGLLWWSGIFTGSTPAQQSAAVTNSGVVNTVTTGVTATTNDSLIVANLVPIDAEIATIAQGISAAGSAPSGSQISTLVISFKAVSSQMTTLAAALTTRITNAKGSGVSTTVIATAQKQLTDLNHQIVNMTSQVSAASTNSASTTATATVRLQSLKELQTAQTDLLAARADVASLVQELNIK